MVRTFHALTSFPQGVVKLVMVVVALGLMDRLGRRDLLLWGTAGMTASLACLGAALQVDGAPPLLSAGSLFLYMVSVPGADADGDRP